jgi:hypothetical protein
MRRKTVNFIVDAVAFGCFVLLTTSGIVVRYVLPPGSGRFTSVWGLDRHEWGSIHFWIAVIFLGALTIHLFLHWRWVVSVTRGVPREESGLRVALGLVGVLAVVALAVAPLLSPVEGDYDGPGRGGRSRFEQHSDSDIRGAMTLGDVERTAGVPVDHLVRELGLPSSTTAEERLGHLRREYGFSMADVRRIVDDYTGSGP